MIKLVCRFVLLSVFCVFVACKKGQYYEASLLNELHNTSLAQHEDSPEKGQDAYIDYSSGMYEAMYASMDKLVGDVLTMLKQDGTTYYRVGFKPPYSIDIQAKEHIPTTISNYQDDMSLLDEPLKQIIKNTGKESVYITDFELVNSLERLHEAKDCSGKLLKLQLNPNAWAVEEFESWLKAGHAIDVYAHRFERMNKAVQKTQVQYLYVLVFTPKHLIESNKSLKTRFYEKFKGRLSNDLRYFSFGSSALCTAQSKDFNAQQGGLHESIAPLEDVIEMERAQYYSIEFASAQTYVSQDPDNKDKRLLKGIFINSQDFQEVSLTAKTYAYTSEYDRFNEFKNGQNESEDENTEIDPESGDTLKKAAVKRGEAFKAGQGKALEQVFEATHNKTTGEVGLKFHPEFVGPETRGELYRVDIVVQKAVYEPPKDMSEVLQWQDARCFTVRSLHESLLEAMKRTEKVLDEQILFTYYISLK
ncbi:MAG: hypothetical protein EAZ67_10635 [Cytophagales bacterium]|nr:MAG: hypothetical protein EAZ67_10635 [Cytophagales bacterium]